MRIEKIKYVQVMNKISRLVPRSKFETWYNSIFLDSCLARNDRGQCFVEVNFIFFQFSKKEWHPICFTLKSKWQSKSKLT